MYFSQSSLLLTVAAPLASAFPSAIYEAIANEPRLAADAEKLARVLDRRQAGAGSATLLFEPVPIFDKEKQYINITKGSGHEFVAPGPNDLRGPCPGLNAFANHSQSNFRSKWYTPIDHSQISYHTVVMPPSNNTSIPLRKLSAWVHNLLFSWQYMEA
jgi:hypothetical protein